MVRAALAANPIVAGGTAKVLLPDRPVRKRRHRHPVGLARAEDRAGSRGMGYGTSSIRLSDPLLGGGCHHFHRGRTDVRGYRDPLIAQRPAASSSRRWSLLRSSRPGIGWTMTITRPEAIVSGLVSFPPSPRLPPFAGPPIPYGLFKPEPDPMEAVRFHLRHRLLFAPPVDPHPVDRRHHSRAIPPDGAVDVYGLVRRVGHHRQRLPHGRRVGLLQKTHWDLPHIPSPPTRPHPLSP